MKFNIKFLCFVFIILIGLDLFITKSLKSLKNKKAKIKKLKANLKKAKEQLKIELHKNEELTKKLKTCVVGGLKEFSSFMETSSSTSGDPLFKLMKQGFPKSEKNSFSGIPQTAGLPEIYPNLVRCPAGCFVAS